MREPRHRRRVPGTRVPRRLARLAVVAAAAALLLALHWQPWLQSPSPQAAPASGARGHRQQYLPTTAPASLPPPLSLPVASAADAKLVCTSFRYDFACAIHGPDDRLLCWRHSTGDRRAPPPTPEHRYASISCRGDEVVGVLLGGGIGWSTNLWAPERVPTPDTSPDAYAEWQSAIAEAASEGVADAVSVVRAPGGGPGGDVFVRWDAINPDAASYLPASVSAEFGHTCAIRRTPPPLAGQMVCWPQADVFSDAFRARYTVVSQAESTCLVEGSCKVNVDPRPTCAITTLGEVQCAFGAEFLMNNVPTGQGFTDVAVGVGHACALHESGAVQCFGENIAGRTGVPRFLPDIDEMVSEALTDASVSASEVETTSKFSGSRQPIGGVDNALYRFTSVTVTDFFSCGVLGVGRALCWGAVTDTLLELPGPGCPMSSISSNGFHSCGRLELQSGDNVRAAAKLALAEVASRSESTTSATDASAASTAGSGSGSGGGSDSDGSGSGISESTSSSGSVDGSGTGSGPGVAGGGSNGPVAVNTSESESSGAPAAGGDSESFLGEGTPLTVGRVGNSSQAASTAMTSIYCWQSIPVIFLGLDFPTEQWANAHRRVPLAVQPSLDTLAECMGLPSREASYNVDRVESLIVALLLCMALFLSLYRLLILFRYGDFNWSETVMQHKQFWVNFIVASIDVTTGGVFLGMDFAYISFRSMHYEFGGDHAMMLNLASLHLAAAAALFVAAAVLRAHDEFYSPTNPRGKGPILLSRRVFNISTVVFLLSDVPQVVFQGFYYQTMIQANLPPSVTAILSTVMSTCAPLYMLFREFKGCRRVASDALLQARIDHPGVGGWELRKLMAEDQRKNQRNVLQLTKKNKKAAAAAADAASEAGSNVLEKVAAGKRGRGTGIGGGLAAPSPTKALNALAGFGAGLGAFGSRVAALAKKGKGSDSGEASPVKAGGDRESKAFPAGTPRSVDDDDDYDRSLGSRRRSRNRSGGRVRPSPVGGGADSRAGDFDGLESAVGGTPRHGPGGGDEGHGGGHGDRHSDEYDADALHTPPQLPRVRTAKQLHLAAQKAKLLGSTRRGKSARDLVIEARSLHGLTALNAVQPAKKKPAAPSGGASAFGDDDGFDDGGAGVADGRHRLPALGASRRQPGRRAQALAALGRDDRRGDGTDTAEVLDALKQFGRK